jgi:hypothetical protein
LRFLHLILPELLHSSRGFRDSVVRVKSIEIYSDVYSRMRRDCDYRNHVFPRAVVPEDAVGSRPLAVLQKWDLLQEFQDHLFRAQ